MIDRPKLRFYLDGPADDRLRVFLIAGAETPHAVQPTGTADFIEWDVSALTGQQVVLVVEDRSETGAVLLDQVALAN